MQQESIKLTNSDSKNFLITIVTKKYIFQMNAVLKNFQLINPEEKITMVSTKILNSTTGSNMVNNKKCFLRKISAY